MSGRGPVAIVGIGCRFPGGVNDTASFWELLESGRDPIAPMPAGRFDVARFLHPEPGTPGKMVTADGGFLNDIEMFDAAFFGLSPREARKIDPQHRLLLEVAWEALEDAGIPVSSLAGRRVGVYVGVWSGEYENVMYRTPAELDFHSITGGGRYAASGRISYAFDLRGPAMTVDTGCSASLVALHLARQAIESGEADLAIVGAANLVLQPHVNVGYSRSGMLSAGARCRFGDDGAAGYVRSDGVAALVLKPLEHARADSDRVRGVLLATAVNADGRGSGQLATPSADAQAELLETVYERAGVDPASVPYVEAHGTGTRAGDPVELEALGRVLGRGRAPDAPLVVGSVKSVIGHTEAAAGMAGLIKTLLALEHRVIPANLHLRTPNETIEWGALRVEIPTSARAWPGGAPLIAGVSSFGITGTNAHAVVAAAPSTVEANGAGPDEHASVVAVSARTPEGLNAAAESLRHRLVEHPDAVLLRDLSYATTCRRDHHEYRLALVAESVADVVAGLDDHLGEESSGRAITGTAQTPAPTVAFIFSGQGSQWLGMGRELMSHAAVFAEWMERCDAALRPFTGWSLLDVIRGSDAERLERVDVVQPTLACVQISLAEQLHAWGVAPAAVAGHSMGEVAAAYCAGALSLEDALRVIAVRSRLLSGIAGSGAMALVDLTLDEVAKLIEPLDGKVAIASINGPRSTVISGDPVSVDGLLAKLDADGVFCRRVKVDVASHSAQTDPLLGPLREELSVLRPMVPHAAFHSTARPGAPTDALLDENYWVDNLRRPVHLKDTVQAMIAAGIDTFVEIAPHPVLLSSLGDIAADADAQIRAFAGLRRQEPELRRSLELLARLHVTGVPIAWQTLASPAARVMNLPAYPWQRERHWLDQWEDWSGGESASHASPRPENADDVGYVINWRPYEPAPLPAAPDERWIIVGDASGMADGIGALITADGASVSIVTDQNALTAQLRAAGTALTGVIDVRAVTARADRDPSSFDAALSRVFVDATDMVSTLLRERVAPSRGTWFVTSGAQASTGRAADIACVPQAAVWGVARTSAADNPELKIRIMDADPARGADAARDIWSVVADTAPEDQVALTGATANAARLVRADREQMNTPVRWRQDVSYLVTGGLGDLGLLVAEEMARSGVRRLVLTGRTTVPSREQWSSPDTDAAMRGRLERVRALEHLGVSIQLASFDVGDADALRSFVDRFRAEGWPPIRGVVHAAGTFDTSDTSTDAFRGIARGKALGAYNLHVALPELDHLVLFSSIASVLPQSNLNYAAANAVLDSLAAARMAGGQHAVSLSWGAWAGAGMMKDAQVSRFTRILESLGLSSFPPEEATSLFRWAAGSTAPHMMLAKVDWTVAQGRLGASQRSFYSELIADETRGGAAERREALLSLPESRRRAALAERVRAIVADVLQLPATAVSTSLAFGKQGLDSLMGVEFRNRLEIEFGLRLPASLAWNYPTTGVLAEFLSSAIADDAESTPDSAASFDVDTPRSVGALIADLDAQSEEDVLRQLRGEAV